MHRCVVLCVLMFASACRDDVDGEPLAHQIDDMGEHADALRAEVDAHATAAEAASDLAAWQATETQHDSNARDHMAMLGHAIGDMGMCDGAPSEDIDGMMQMHDMCDDEMQRHTQAIAAATDLAAVQAEEAQHRVAMMDRLDELDAMGDGMMDSHGSMMCGGHHGIDDHEDP
jgi:hypothetical protein